MDDSGMASQKKEEERRRIMIDITISTNKTVISTTLTEFKESK